MARRSDALGVSGAETIIGAGVIAEGNLHSEGDILIDGTYTGQIKTPGDVTLGTNANVTAGIEARNVMVIGSLTGNIVAEGEAAIRESGHVTGDITCVTLAIHSGAIFVGRSIMQPAPTIER